MSCEVILSARGIGKTYAQPVLGAVDPRLREAARTLGAGPLRVLATVDGPFLLRGLGVAAGFAFAIGSMRYS